MDRRELLVRAGLTFAAGALTGRGLKASAAGVPPEKSGSPPPDWSDWEAIRSQFELTRDRVHLAGLLLASNPLPVRESIARHRQGLDASPAEYFHAAEGDDVARVAAAKYLGANASEIALTDSTTMGLAILYGGIHVQDGQEILATTHDHYATYESLRLRAMKTGAKFRKVRLYADSARATEKEIADNLAAAITDITRVVAVTWVHSSTGVKLPIRRLADVIASVNHRRNSRNRVLFCVDGVHGFGVENVTVEELGCDFFSAGCHKWIFGPRGTGLLWGRAEVAAEVDPLIPSFNFGGRGTWGKVMTPGGFHSFEQRWSLAPAFEFHLAIGKKRVQDRIHAFSAALKEKLASIEGVRLHTPRAEALSAGLVCFEVDGLTPAQVVEKCAARKIVASTTPYEVSYARFTPGILNTPRDLDTAAEAIREIARAAARA